MSTAGWGNINQTITISINGNPTGNRETFPYLFWDCITHILTEDTCTAAFANIHTSEVITTKKSYTD